MIENCKMCDKEILTEADNHAWVLKGKPLNWEINCGCYFNAKLKRQNKFMQDQLLNVAQFLDKLALLIDEHSKIQGELNASQKEG